MNTIMNLTRSILLLIILLFLGCSKEEELSFDEFPQVWTLTKMTGMMAGSELTGEQLPFSEQILFEEDMTFVKTRTEDGIARPQSGTFSVTTKDDHIRITLEYDRENDLIESCTGGTTEYYHISGDELIGGAVACDRPGLYYRRS